MGRFSTTVADTSIVFRGLQPNPSGAAGRTLSSQSQSRTSDNPTHDNGPQFVSSVSSIYSTDASPQPNHLTFDVVMTQRAFPISPFNQDANYHVPQHLNVMCGTGKALLITLSGRDVEIQQGQRALPANIPLGSVFPAVPHSSDDVDSCSILPLST